MLWEKSGKIREKNPVSSRQARQSGSVGSPTPAHPGTVAPCESLAATGPRVSSLRIVTRIKPAYTGAILRSWRAGRGAVPEAGAAPRACPPPSDEVRACLRDSPCPVPTRTRRPKSASSATARRRSTSWHHWNSAATSPPPHYCGSRPAPIGGHRRRLEAAASSSIHISQTVMLYTLVPNLVFMCDTRRAIDEWFAWEDMLAQQRWRSLMCPVPTSLRFSGRTVRTPSGRFQVVRPGRPTRGQAWAGTRAGRGQGLPLALLSHQGGNPAVSSPRRRSFAPAVRYSNACVRAWHGLARSQASLLRRQPPRVYTIFAVLLLIRRTRLVGLDASRYLPIKARCVTPTSV